MKLTAKEIASALGGTVEGNPDVIVNSFAKIEHGRPGALSFYANPKYEKYVYTSKSSVMLVNADFKPKEAVSATLIRVENAYTAVAQMLKLVSDLKRRYRRHRAMSTCWTCGISLRARLGRKVWVGDYVRIGPRTRIGDCSIIHSNVTIGEDVVPPSPSAPAAPGSPACTDSRSAPPRKSTRSPSSTPRNRPLR